MQGSKFGIQGAGFNPGYELRDVRVTGRLKEEHLRYAGKKVNKLSKTLLKFHSEVRKGIYLISSGLRAIIHVPHPPKINLSRFFSILVQFFLIFQRDPESPEL